MAGETEGSRRIGALVAVAVVVVGGVVGLVTNAASSDDRWPWLLDHLRVHPWPALAVFLSLLAVLGVVNVGIGRGQAERARAESFSRNREALATQVRARLDEQLGPAKLRRVIDVPMSRHQANHGAVRIGGLADVVKSTRGHCRLIVVGAVGSGKSTALLQVANELMTFPDQDAAIPVLVNLSTWKPAEERLDDVIRRAITGVRRDTAQKRRAWWRLRRRSKQVEPTDLISDKRVLPLLDGLDEIPRESWDDARRELDTALGAPDRQFALTCVEGVFSAIMPADVITARGTQVVRIEPVTTASAGKYLLETTTDPDKWRPVLTRVNQQGSAVAQALSTPLMLYLARVVFERRNPGELLAQRLTTREAVEAELLESYVPAAYAPAEQSGDLATRSTVRFDAADAEHWLRYLASFLDKHQATVLRWWELADHATPAPRRLPSRWPWLVWSVSVASGVVLLPFFIAFLAGILITGLWLAVKSAKLVLSLARGWDEQNTLTELYRWLGTIDAGDSLWSLLWSAATTPVVVLVIVLLSFVLSLGLASWYAMEADETEVFASSSARDAVHADARVTRIRAVLAFGLTFLVLFMVKDALWGWFSQTAAPWYDDAVRTSNDRLVADGADASRLPTFGGVTSWTVDVQDVVSWWSIGICALAGCFTAGAVVVNSAWWHLRAVVGKRVVLRQLPSDLLTFLDDANRRGVLRRYGQVFEFRHRRVQWFLADRKRAGRASGEIIQEARELAADGKFKQAVDQLTRLVTYDDRACPALAEINERWAEHRTWNPFGRDARASRLHAAQSWWEQAIDNGDPDAPVELAEFHARRLDSFPGTLIGGIRSYRTHQASTRSWTALASTPARDRVATLLEERVSRPSPTLLHRLLRAHLEMVLERVRATVPLPVDEPHWWSNVSLGEVAAQALQHAVPDHEGVLHTGAVLAALMEVDPRVADWERFRLHTGSLAADDLRRALDANNSAAFPPLPLGAGDWTITASEDLMIGLRLLPLMVEQYGMTPILPGALGLAVLSAPDGGAARMLRAFGRLDNAGLRTAAKTHLLGAPELPDIKLEERERHGG